MKLYTSKYLQIIKNGKNVFIYHSLFGNLFKSTEDILNLINFFRKGNIIENAEKEFGIEIVQKIEELKNRRFLIREGLDERKLLKNKIKEIEEKITTGELLYKLQLMVTTECNLRCAYCFRNKLITPLIGKKEKMTFQVAKKAIDGFLNITKRNKKEKVYIKFLGGEPLLNLELIIKLVDYVNSLKITKPKINFILCTNGVNINDFISEFLSKNNFSISISLDGVGEVHDRLRKKLDGNGTFSEINNSIDILNKYNNKIIINAVLTNSNLYHLKELIDYLNKKGIKHLNINTLRYKFLMDLEKIPIEEIINQLIDARKYGKEKGVIVGGKWFRLYRKANEMEYLNYCRRMGEMFSVEPSGDVYPCSGWPMKIGDVENMDSILTSNEYRKIASRVVGNIPSCYGCEIEGMCAGGCAGNAYILTGDCYNADLEDCEFRKEIVKKLILTEDWETSRYECIQI